MTFQINILIVCVWGGGFQLPQLALYFCDSIHLFLLHGSKPMGETSGSLAVIDN